jgi:hypothetical protein
MNEVHSDNKKSYNCHLCTKVCDARINFIFKILFLSLFFFNDLSQKYKSFWNLKGHVTQHLAKIRCELIEAGRKDEIEELIASAAIPLQQQPPCKPIPLSLTAAGTKLEEERVVGSHLTLKDCSIRLKRVGYLETAVKKGYKWIDLSDPNGSKFLCYPPVP